MILESTLDITHESTIKHEITNSKFNLSYMHFDTTLYDEFLTNKTNQVKSLFQDYPHLGSIDDLLVVKSPVSNYRNRCRFSIADSNDHSSDSEQININSYQNIYYTMYEEGAASVKVMKFPIAVNSIVNLMEPILDCIKNNEELALGLRSLNFLSSLDGQVIISFCYERPIDLIWKNAASEIRTFLLQSNLPYVKDLNFIGRSKKIKMVIGSDTVLESIQLQDGRLLKYYQVDDGFSNPNAIVNISVLNWVCESVKYCNQHFCNQGGREGTNILELFCGNGNHTVAIAGFANRVVAVELNKSLCKAAEQNLLLNNIHNVHVVAGDSQKFAYKVLKKMSYTIVTLQGVQNESEKVSVKVSEKVSETIEFDMILVDPPRCGLDPSTRKLIGAYKFILYISCNPDALHRDIQSLIMDYSIARLALFDQFAYTPHIECGVLLQRRS